MLALETWAESKITRRHGSCQLVGLLDDYQPQLTGRISVVICAMKYL